MSLRACYQSIPPSVMTTIFGQKTFPISPINFTLISPIPSPLRLHFTHLQSPSLYATQLPGQPMWFLLLYFFNNINHHHMLILTSTQTVGVPRMSVHVRTRTLDQSKRHVPPEPIRTPESLSRLDGQMRFLTQSRIAPKNPKIIQHHAIVPMFQ